MTAVLEVDPERVISDLRELAALTGDAAGAQRLAWTAGWERARELVAGRCAEVGVAGVRDRAANLWFVLEGDRPGMLVAGSHLDSVPDGGWLDGALGVLAGVELLRAAARGSREELPSLAVVDWADEEGARFGRSLFGSSAAAGELDAGELAVLRDADGVSAAQALGAYGVDLGGALAEGGLLGAASAYIELHIEQGPVLEAASLPVAAVDGTVGIARDVLRFEGQAAHAGTTPMGARRDAFLAAAEAALAIERAARARGATATCGRVELEPGVATAVPGAASLWVDLRHRDARELAALRAEVLGLAEGIAGARRCSVARRAVWSIEPRAFDCGLVELALEACRGQGGLGHTLTSGALHDAAMVAPLVPTAMVLCASVGGLSHTREEDSRPDDLRRGVLAFARLAELAMAQPWESAGSG
jgi:hydantoinase/carbamoylase family amidase